MKKTKLDKKDLLAVSLLALAFGIFVIVVLQFKYNYGSTLDWESQHSTIPDYFRLLFYKTHDLFPDFAFNLGSGQNIYNFAYYGFLSPIIFVSYLLPFVDMADYIALSSILAAISSSILFYFWLQKNKGATPLTAFLASFTFLFATSLSFHSHRHVMFMNYMPFMVLGLFGVDKMLDDKRGWLLSLAVFLMVMTSYYYSVGGIVFLVIYGIMKWIEKQDKCTISNFFKDGLKFLVPIIIGIISSAIIILPTFHVILSSRGETFNTITWADLFLPSINIDYMLYNTYGIGLTAILILAIINLLFKKKEKRFLGIVLALLLIFPFLNYILNATMYIDGKALIPLLPLAVYAIFLLLEDILNKKVDYKKLVIVLSIVLIGIILKGKFLTFFFVDLIILGIFLILYNRWNKKFLLVIPVLAIPFTASLSVSLNDEYVNRKKYKTLKSEYKEVLSTITDNDDSFYRISNAKTILRDVNNLYGNIDYFTSTIYSSTYNMNYNKFYYDIMDNPIQNRNRVITSPTSNILFLMFSGNKYLIDNNSNYFGYEPYEEVSGYRILKNDDVFPLMYAREGLISTEDFDDLEYPERMLALLNGVVVDGNKTLDYTPQAEKFDFDSSLVNTHGTKIIKNDDVYEIDATDGNKKITYTVPEDKRDKIIFVQFKMLESAPCSEGDTSIVIDKVKNKLTCKSWKYHNQNYDFQYVLANKDKSKLEITFTKGKYRIKDIELYYIDYDEIKNQSKNVDEFKFDQEKTKGDFIEGSIDVRNDGYFVTSIPYDEGFSILVDGQKVEYEKVNKAFLGFPIKKGHHEVQIEYKAPLKKLAVYVSLVGLFSFILMVIIQNRRK